ncbi:MAG: hypothetical protein K5868_07565 [Lachnospiraceae bacterium]|nr:hypothetical protein [Lachnospiraceae bacterium]
MDKYEYNLRNEEINDLMSHRDYVRAVEIADTIDWTRVRSVKTLCKISDLYKVNKRYDEAKVLLEQAYEKMPTGKPIVSSLCELCIKMGDVVGATEYYKRYVQMAPTSNQKFVLLYKIYEAQDVSLEERIQVLEELNKREPAAGKGKWSYELASLYNRIGLTTKCVQQCDELITLLREGRYVKKAMELKMLHQQLTSSQEMLYKNISSGQEAMTGYVTGEIEQEQITDTEQAESTEEVREEADMPVDTVADTSDNSIVNVEPHEELVKTVDVGQYSTINIQKALEESIKGTLGSDSDREESEERYEDETKILPSDALNKFKSIVTDDSATDNEPSDNEAPVTEDTPVASSEESPKPGSITETIMAPMMQDTGEMEEIVFPDEPASEDTIVYDPKEKERIKASATAALNAVDIGKVSKEELMKLIDEKVAYALDSAMNGQKKVEPVNPPRSMQKMLSQEYDGQISLVVPEQNPIEKQITGQIDIEDYLNDWENSKKQFHKQQTEQLDKLVSDHTGSLLTDFDLQNKGSIDNKIEEEAALEAEVNEELPEVEELTDIEETPEIPEDENVTEAAEGSVEEETAESEEKLSTEADKDTTDSTSDEDSSSDTGKQEATEEEPDPEAAAIEAEHIAAAEAEAEDSEDDGSVRTMTEEESALFSSFVQTKKGKQDLIKALDSISLASYVGNVCVTGETGEESVDLAKNVVQYAKMTDSNFSGKIGKVSGSALNEKDMDALIEKLKGGGMIVEKAGDMSDETADKLYKALNQENLGILVVLQDSRKAINKLLSRNEGMKQMFGVHIEIEELSDDALVAYGKKYAEKNEFSIDDMGVLALHTRIDEMQTSDHIVTVSDVRDLVDEAIEHATKFSPKHFTEILFGKRYDDDDMIILKERDFIA